jgi:hypothetical protein
MKVFENYESKPNYNKFKLLEDNYEIILSEIPLFDINKVTIYRQYQEWNNEDGILLAEKLSTNTEWIGAWDISKKWFNFPLMGSNNVIGFAEQICPKTISLLKELGEIHIAGFSLLLPGATLQPHTDATGPSYNSMALNMHLSGYNSNLYVKINDSFQIYTHVDGKLVIFNSENLHYADNMGNENRIILYIDFGT